jgi:3-deoxy-7-phosphoheptulonate synthase
VTGTINNLRVSSFEPLESPDAIKRDVPLSPHAAETVIRGREEIRAALRGEERRLLVILGPCSIHDPDAAREYAARLMELGRSVREKMIIVMRFYFEKPRTTIGWKGLINGPKRDETFDINAGLRLARRLLVETNALGLPCATEFLDPIVPQYTADLISWAAIGARTTESQTHREMASGLSMPVGFKNATDGNIETAVEAMVSALHPHAFLGIDQSGRSCIVRTTGNPDVHLVLRGGGERPNYFPADIARAGAMVGRLGRGRRVLVDCSHGNSGKDHTRQPAVFSAVLAQRLAGDDAILGMMLESNLEEGRQDVAGQPSYGVSITDACIGWKTTREVILSAHEAIP